MKLFRHLSQYRWWRIIRWPLAVIVFGYIALVIWGIPKVAQKERTAETVALIHAQKLTLDDVLGKNLPPPPDPVEANATVEGIDANANGIRDDVEWAIFNKYPNSARIRAAQLQYAMALQNELTNVFNSETLVAAIQEEAHALSCLTNAGISDRLQSEIKSLILNTELRQEKRKSIFDNYMSSFTLESGPHCQIDLSSL